MRSPMTRPEPHRIQRQVLELEFAAGMPGFESQERLARAVHDSVIPALSEVFDEAAGPGDWLRVERLALDLGTISAADWAPQLRQRLVDQVRRELARHAPRRDPVRSDPRGEGRAGGATARWSQSAVDTPAQRARRAPEREPASADRRMQQLLFFLAHGRLPWWGDRPADGFGAEFARGHATIAWEALRASLRGDAAARSRLVDVLDDAQLEAGIAHWCGVPHAAQALAASATAVPTPATQRAWRHAFWLATIDWASAGAPHAGREVELVRALTQAWRATVGGPTTPTPDASARGAQPAPKAAPWPDAAAWPSPWREWLAMPSEEAAVVRAEPGAREAPAPVLRAQTRPSTDASPRRVAADDDERAVYVAGAGIVLVHPFLATLFADRALLDGRAFRDDAARARAVRLVGLLAFGDAEAPEYDLGLAKQLCGHPLEDPLAPGVLDPDDLRACDELLAAVLGHWTALRSSSTAWLRAQFFLRDGKLEGVDLGCRLTIERRAQDVLLSRLPWGFGVIGLPWMKDRIFVHWLD